MNTFMNAIDHIFDIIGKLCVVDNHDKTPISIINIRYYLYDEE